jgi:hypothetical protein
MSSDQGRNSGGDLLDMAKDGTTVPSSAAEPRIIPSKPRPDQIASDSDFGGTNLAEAADNQGDIPRVRLTTFVSDYLLTTLVHS